MNDLAEKALHGLDVARREVRARPMLSFAVVGFLLGCVVVGAGGVVAAARPTRPLTSWFGLQDAHGTEAADWVPGAIMLGGIAALVVVWVGVVAFVRRTAPPARRVWWTAAAWAAPFALGPPLMDTTVYSYAAFGLLQRNGHSPYDSGASRLGDSPIVAAIDPGARGVPSSAGPLGTLAQHLAISISAGSVLGAVLVLRVASVLAAIVIARRAAELGGPRRARALTLTALNPLLLLYVVSSAHLEGLMIALVLAALAAAHRRHWLRAVVLGCLAGCVLGPGFIVVPAIVAGHWVARRAGPGWRLLARDVAVVAGTTAVVGFAVSDGFGWLRTVSHQFSAESPFSVAGATAKLLDPIVRGASYDDLAAGARITTVTAMVCVLGYLIVTARQRPVDRTAGYSLLAMALLAPVLSPWYLLWGTLCLAPRATRMGRLVVLTLCAAGCVLSPQGFGETATDAITGAWLVLVTAGVVAVLLHGRRVARAAAAEQPKPARRPRPVSAGS